METIVPAALSLVTNSLGKDDEKISIRNEQHQGDEQQQIHINIHCCEFLSPCCARKQQPTSPTFSVVRTRSLPPVQTMHEKERI